MKHFVVGLPFTAAADRVALIRKNRPAWQAGKLNGPGGKVEAGETALQAIAREIREECAIDVPESGWIPVAILQDPEVRVDVFACFDDRVRAVATGTDEPIVLFSPADPVIVQDGLDYLDVLIARALERERTDILQLGTVRPKDEALAVSWP